MSRNAGSDENSRFDDFCQTDVGQSDNFYAKYITRSGVNMLTNLAIFMQITSQDTRVELTILTNLPKAN